MALAGLGPAAAVFGAERGVTHDRPGCEGKVVRAETPGDDPDGLWRLHSEGPKWPHLGPLEIDLPKPLCDATPSAVRASPAACE